MKNIIKACSLLAIIGVVYGANAASPRVGVNATKSMSRGSSVRLPSISGNVVTYNNSSSSTTTAALLSNTDCIDGYTNCLKGSDVCGSDLEECTTNVLLHGKMPNCLGLLYQCSNSGVSALFGTSSIDALSNIAEKNAYGEVTRYTYPTDGSVLGQMVIGANISNKLPMDQCVKKYQNCLKRDSVCGENFELCTSFNEFRKQSINCAGTLARCQSDGLIELFGSANTAIAPSGTSRIGVAIADGASFAAANAVNTCYKVIDTCLVNACTKNPWRCVEGVNMTTIQTADFVAGGQTGENTTTSTLTGGENGVTSDFNLYSSTGQDVRKFIKGSCLATIGGNKYCYMTFQEKTPKDRDLADIDNQEDVFSLAYAARKEFANTKIQDILKKFDKRAKDSCIQTLSSCVRGACGRGVGTLCYKQSKVGNGLHVNTTANYNEIKSGCEAIINMDANCQYAANSAGDDGYSYAYTDETVFTKLFPQYTDESTGDPIGAVASINAMLASNYNDAAIEKLRKDCSSIAMGCIKSMCGTDYINCYRNRTDVISGGYKTGGDNNANGFDKSMNKMGGVLDYNIVTGLCVNMIKDSKSCEEHLKIEAADLTIPGSENSWGGATSVRNAWMDTASSITGQQTMVTIGCTVSKEAAAANTNCDTITVRECNTVDDAGCAYTEAYQQGIDEYTLNNSANTLLQKLLMDVEKEAQAKYNAKLTKEQNICLSNNTGGIMGAEDNGSSFMWVKLKNGKIPSSYSVNGLKSSDFTASNDLYGSFCRAKIRMMSTDKNVQDYFASHDMTRYFAVGDAFTCGSWLTQSNLDEITKKIGEKARKDAGEGSSKEKTWSWLLPTLVGTATAVGGFAGMDALQKSDSSLGGILKNNAYKTAEDIKSLAKQCEKDASDAEIRIANAKAANTSRNYADAMKEYNLAVARGNAALVNAKKINDKAGVKTNGLDNISFSPISYTDGSDGTTSTTYEWTSSKDSIISLITSKFTPDAEGISPTNTQCGKGCHGLFKAVINILNGAASQEAAASAKTVYADALKSCYTKADGNEDSGAKVKCESAAAGLDSLMNYLVESKKSTNGAVSGGLTGFAENQNIDTKSQEMLNNLQVIRKTCESHMDEKEKGNGRLTKNLIAGAAAGTVGVLGTIAIQKAVRENKYEKAENDAINKWMDEVGDKIKCYLGGTELGSYGEMISLEIN